MELRRSYFADQLIGFLIPLGLFIEIGSPILLATSPIAQEGFAFPLSMIALPLALYLGAVRKSSQPVYPQWISYAAAVFTLYCLVVSGLSTYYRDPSAILYGIQWCLPFLWMPYFSTISDFDRFQAFIKAFCIGTAFTVVYYSSSGFIEYALYGGLLDGGRLSQNFIFPGQYQIAVYVPTIISYSVIMIGIAQASGIISIRKPYLYIIYIMTAFALAFLAAREALLVIIVYTTVWMITKDGFLRALGVIAVASIAILISNPSVLSENLAGSEFRLLTKFANLDDSDRYLGGRDEMIQEVLMVVRDNPIFGTNFLPPNMVGQYDNISAPSAHNMYVDVIAWSGAFGGAIYIFICVYLLFLAAKRFIWSYSRYKSDYLGRYCAILLVVFLLVSNNLNVPMRQPLMAPFFAMLIYVCSYWSAPKPVEAGRAAS